MEEQNASIMKQRSADQTEGHVDNDIYSANTSPENPRMKLYQTRSSGDSKHSTSAFQK